MRISEREAARHLHLLCGLTRTPGRRLLRTGIAGESFRGHDGRTVLYDADRVAEVGRRAVPPDAELAEVLPVGALQLRLAPEQLWRLAWSPRRRLEILAEHAPTAFLRMVELVGLVNHLGPLPMVATVSGFVVGGAEVGAPVVRNGRLALSCPGPWLEALDGRPWPSSRGGLALQWHDAVWRRSPDRMTA